MLQNAKNFWLEFRHWPPGERFCRLYEEYAEHDSELIRTTLMFVALACFTIGVSFLFVQGPAFVLFLLTGVILATQSSWLAQKLDSAELSLRHVGRELRRLRKTHGPKRRALPSPARLTAGQPSR